MTAKERTNAPEMTAAQLARQVGETADAIAARVADEHLQKIISHEVHSETDLDSGIEEVYQALCGDGEPEDEDEAGRMAFARAGYLIGVQVGLRLRGVQ